MIDLLGSESTLIAVTVMVAVLIAVLALDEWIRRRTKVLLAEAKESVSTAVRLRREEWAREDSPEFFGDDDGRVWAAGPWPRRLTATRELLQEAERSYSACPILVDGRGGLTFVCANGEASYRILAEDEERSEVYAELVAGDWREPHTTLEGSK